MSVLTNLADWASSLTFEEIPDRVVDLAASQLLSQLAAIRVGLEQDAGRRLVAALGPPFQADVSQSARVLAGAGAWLNLDDTGYAGHLSPSTVAVPVALAHAARMDGAELLRSVVVSTECAARITASATLGPFRGQTAVHTHLVGAAAAQLSSERAPAERWTDALALALSAPPWTLMRGFIASDARLLHVPLAVRAGFDACAAAAAGLSGPPDIIEHPDGFLTQFALVPLPEVVDAGLGRRWHTETLSFKTHPGGPGIDAAVDCAADLHAELGEWVVGDVEAVTVDASLYTVHVARKAEPYMDGPRTPLGALVLTVPYPVATALLEGRLTIHDFHSPAVDDSERWALAAKVELVHSPAMTRELMRGDAPFGEAVRQAGPRAEPWLRSFGGPDLVDLVGEPGPPLRDFTRAVKATPARVSVRMRGGSVFTRTLTVPRGAAGPDLRRRHRTLVVEKFRAAGGPAEVVETWPELATLKPDDLARLLESALGVNPPSHRF